MKKNRTMRVAVLMLALTLLTCCFVGSTFAKYTSSADSTVDTARVAKWAFDIDGTDIVATNTFTFDLFTTVCDVDANTGKVILGTDNALVQDTDIDDSEVIIAPGCGGYVTVVLTNASEVNAIYDVVYTANEAGVPLEWSVDNTTWADDVTALNVDDAEIDMNDGTANITLYYRWAFEGGEVDTWTDADDTTLGKAGTATPTITAKVTVTQVD